MNKPMRAITSLIMCVMLASGCAGSNTTESQSVQPNENQAAQTAESQPEQTAETQSLQNDHIRAYNYPHCGFSFDLPESAQIEKGFLYTVDNGPEVVGVGLCSGYIYYYNATEEELNTFTEEEYKERGVVDGNLFMVICDTQGRDKEAMIQDYADLVLEATGEEMTQDEFDFFHQFSVIHKDDARVWYIYQYPEESLALRDYDGDYLQEYTALVNGIDEIVNNMVFYEPEGSTLSAPGTQIQFETTNLDGNTVKSEDLFASSKLTMFYIWGVGCTYCIDEMPEIEAISKEYADQGVAVVGLVSELGAGTDSLLEETEKICQEKGVTFQMLRSWDGHRDVIQYNMQPTTYFVDSTGKTVGEALVGTQPMAYRARIDQYLEELK